MKLLLLLLSIFFCSSLISQDYGGTIKYKQTFENSVMNMSNNFQLLFCNELSIYIESKKASKKQNTYKQSNNQNDAYHTTKMINIDSDNKSDFYIFDPIKKSFYFGIKPFAKQVIVEEDENLYSWKRIDSTKSVGKFICHKATTTFRGRNYTAWYTKEIPVPYGPWKFNSLEGLILEVYDESLSFRIVATSLELESKIPNDIPKVKETLDVNNSMSISEYLNYEKNEITELFKRMSSKLPKGSAPLKIDNNCSDCGKALEIFDVQKD